MLPPELTRLLETTDSKNREAAWDAFIEKFHRLLMRVAHSIDDHYDARMDRYAYMLEQLRAGDYRRLRRYGPQSRAQFSTWLVVVARRLCVDFHRETHGRQRPTSGQQINRDELRFIWRSLGNQTNYRFTLTTAEGEGIWITDTADTALAVPPTLSMEPNLSYIWFVDVLLLDGTAATSGIRRFTLTR